MGTSGTKTAAGQVAGIAAAICAFAAIGVANRFHGVPTYSYGVFFVLVFLWLGISQRPWTSTAMAPLATFIYLLPFAGRGDPNGLRSAWMTIPVCVVAGEVLARFVAELRQERAKDQASNQALAVEAVTDELTGVGNRRQGNALLNSLEPGDALLLLDLDRFKLVNDTFGHAEGDRVLTELGTYLRGAVRGLDAVARYGGEEFVVVLRQAGDGAALAAQRFLDGWRLRSPRTTFSVGVAVHRAHCSPALTFGEADAALYEAKAAGRDRVAAHDVNGALTS